jgi:hypothetical protein
MAQASSKPPIQLVVIELFGDEVVVPPVSLALAGGNSVKITNHLRKEVTVFHNGNLAAPMPSFALPPKASGPPPSVTYPVSPGSDGSGSVFDLHFEASRIRALGAPGDPTIIIL